MIKKLINCYILGTHRPLDLTMGALYGMIYRLDESGFESMASSSIDISASASMLSKFSVSGDVKYKSSSTDSFSKVQKETSIYSFGTPPPQDLNAITWVFRLYIILVVL